MHLGFIDRPFVPHNLISAQESPFPLPNFQMAHGLKILMSSGSKKGTQIYCPILSKQSRQVNPFQVPQWGPYGERYPLTGIFIYLYLFISKAVRKECPSMFPRSRAPIETDAHSRALLNPLMPTDL
jgi:hypothetical protein